MKKSIFVFVSVSFFRCLQLLHALPFKGISTKKRALQPSCADVRQKTTMVISGLSPESELTVTTGNRSHTTTSPRQPKALRNFPRASSMTRIKVIHIFSDRHIYRYSAEHDGFLRIPNIRIPAHESINTASFDPTGHLWIGTTANLYTVSENDSALHSVKQKISVYSILFKNNKHGWAGTSKGIFHLVGLEDDSYLPNREKILSELNSKRIQTLYYDSLTQNLWIGTFGNGLYRYNESSRTLDASNSSPHKLPIRSICAIESDRIWVGMDGEGICESTVLTEN